MDLKELGGALFEAGAPLLRDLLVGAVGGGLKGKIAGAVLNRLIEKIGSNISSNASNEAKADVIAKEIRDNPNGVVPAIREVEMEYVSTTDISSGNLDRYLGLLEGDQKSEGIISRLWRPLFALMYTLVFATQILTFCWMIWTRQWGTLKELGDVTMFLTFMNVAGCAVLGIQVWKKTEEKKSGVA